MMITRLRVVAVAAKGKGGGGVTTTTATVFSTVLYFGSLLNITGFYLNHGPRKIQDMPSKIQNKDLLNFT
jgi:hypothetical protein